MLNILTNIYFLNMLGGFYIIQACLNFTFREYVAKSVGYVYGIPALLLGVAFISSFSGMHITKAKTSKGLFPAILFFSWAVLTAFICGATSTPMFNEMLIYSSFWACIPFLFGVLLSGRISRLKEGWVQWIFILLVGFSLMSIKQNWNEIFYGRYRVTAFSELSENTFGYLVGAYAVYVCNKLHRSAVRNIFKVAAITLIASVSTFIIFLSGSMGGIISLYLSLSIFFLISNGVFRKGALTLRKLFYFAGMLVVTTIAIIMLLNYSQQAESGGGFGIENVHKYITRLDNMAKGTFDQVESVRSYFISLYLDQFCQSPLWGSGFGSRGGIRMDPHNYAVEILGETGAIGLIIYLFIIVPPMRTAFKCLADRKERGILFLLSFMFLVAFFETFFSGSVFIDPQWWFLLGIIPFDFGRKIKNDLKPVNQCV